MGPPNVRNTVRDLKTGVTYDVMAYRKLSREEVIEYVYRALSRMKKSKRPRPGERLTLETLIGADH
jgi:hypothetical protein